MQQIAPQIRLSKSNDEYAVSVAKGSVLSLPEYKERCLFVGANGTGKSLLNASLIDRFPRWVTIDLKGDYGEDIDLDKRSTIIRKPSDWKWNLFPRYVKRIIYRPLPQYARMADLRLRFLYYKGAQLRKKYGKDHQYRFVINVDEGLMQSKTGQTAWLSSLATSGRSLGIGLWVTSQRLSWIPVETRSEAWRIYIFYLSDEDDEKSVIKLTKRRLSLDQLNALSADYSFFEIKRGKAGALSVTKFPPIRLETPGE